MSCIEKSELAVPEEAVGLLMTYRCNLDCLYCYIKKKRNRDMSIAQAKSILEPVLMREAGPVDIIFMGGETLLAINAIRPLVEWAEQLGAKRLFRFVGSTNGTLLTESLKTWLTEHKQTIILGLSYDGTKESQQHNRATGDRVDVDFFIKTWPLQELQMTVNEDSVNQMATGVIELLERGARVHPNVAYEDHEWTEESLREYARQLDLLVSYYTNHSGRFHVTAFQHKLTEYAHNLKQPSLIRQCCGAGNGFTVYDVDGTPYPCHLLSPLVLNGVKLEQIRDGALNQIGSWGDDICSACPFVSSCSTCVASNFIYRHDFCKRDKTHCVVMQLEVQAYMKYRARVLQKKTALTSEDASEVDAITALHSFFMKQ